MHTQAYKRLVEFQLSEAPLSPGEVAIVGAGPGDPGLLTLRALSLLQQADALVFDRLVSAEIMALATPRAERFYVGKAANCHALTQDEINALLVSLSAQGRRVVRLKGGDPYVFGRGGEEAEYLVDHQVHFRVVPGITSAAGCTAYAGFPLTHRDYAQSVTFVTGHLKDDQGLDLNWDALAAPGQTRVFYMGLSNAGRIVRELRQRGLPGDTPAALIERGTTAAQRECLTSLDDLEAAIIREGFKPPTLIVVGEVVRLAERLGHQRREIPSDVAAAATFSM